MTHPVFSIRKGVFLADFHIHSHFSRATSPDMHPAVVNRVAKQKGLSVVGTGDFTHPRYLDELREELEPEGTGLYVCKDDPEGTKFILTSEISNIFTQGGRSRRIHTVFFAPDFQVAEEIQDRLGSIGNISSDGRPIFGFPVKELVKIVMEVSPDCLIVPAHIWTPWFSLFGAKSGFDTLEECFEEQSGHIFALETGLSSDPQMNWRLSALDQYTLISNSDAHSPSKLAREANCFSCGLTYESITAAIKDPGRGFEGTIEFFPEEGKYHYDGHRACGVCMKPKETIEHKGKCPVCGQNLTVGVLHRIEELADRPEGFIPETARPCVHLVPLEEIVAEAFGVRSITGRVKKEYQRLIQLGGSEMDILLWKDAGELRHFVPDRILEGILRMRNGEIKISPGHDGLYGKISIFSEEERKELRSSKTKTSSKDRAVQMDLF
ncbi:MAG: DNA helicase UvrD [Deltaproteobacteria bacterium]|nr:MAG: DNA helicase UvrD [Deltaproteobacteria bacterium]